MNIDKDKLIEMARESGINTGKHNSICEGTMSDLMRLADLVSAHAITSMQTEQEPYAYALDLGDGEVLMPNAGRDYSDNNNYKVTKLYDHPAPVTSMQESISEKCTSEPVGEAMQSPNDKALTIATFNAEIVPTGTKLYAHDRVKGVSDSTTNLYQYEIMDRTHIIRELISSALLDNAGITPEQENLVANALGNLDALYQDAGKNSYESGSQLSTNTDSAQLYEIFSSIEECPPILETDSFIVKRVKEMAQLINSLYTNTDGWVSVPKVATSEILNAIHQAWKTAPMNTDSYVLWEKMYKAMIAISQPKGE